MPTLAQLLPPKARARLAGLNGAVDDARASLSALTGRYENATKTAAVAQQALATADPRSPHRHRFVAEVEAAQAALIAIDTERSKRTQALYRAESALAPITAWAVNFYGPIEHTVFADADVDAASLRRDDENWAQAADRIRAAISHARIEIGMIEREPPPIEQVRAQIAAEVERMARIGEPRVEFAHAPGVVATRVRWPGDRNNHEESNIAWWAATCWLHKDAIEKFLVERAEAEIGDGGSDPSTRPARIAALMQELAELELHEQAVVQAAAAEDIDIARGPASPMALLQVRFAHAPAAAATPLLAAE
jgi:hypothetical protein